MTIPSSPISASAINTELGSSSTDLLSLNANRTRSIAGNLAPGTSYSMSSFAAKSARWIMDITYAGPAINSAPYSVNDTIFSQYTNQESYTRLHCVSSGTDYSPTYLTTYYLNGAVARQSAYYNTAYGTSTSTNSILVSAKSWGTATASIYTTNSIYTTTGADYLVRLSYNGSIIFAKYVTNAYLNVGTNMDVDASENIYVQLGQLSPNVGGMVASFNSSLNFRWARSLTSASVEATIYPSGISSAGTGNLYCTAQYYSSSDGPVYSLYYVVFDLNANIIAQSRHYLSGDTSARFNGAGAAAYDGSFLAPGVGTNYAFFAYYTSSRVLSWVKYFYLYGYNLIFYTKVAWGTYNTSYFYTVSQVNDGSSLRLLVCKIDTAGTIQWARLITGTNVTSGVFTYFDPKSIIVTGPQDNFITIVASMGLTSGYNSYYDIGIFTLYYDGSTVGPYYTGYNSFTYLTVSPALINATPIARSDPTWSTYSFSTTSTGSIVNTTNETIPTTYQAAIPV